MKVAMVSEHANPLAVVGGVDAGGQNVHVAALASALAERGHSVDVYTRRDDPAMPECVPLRDGVLVHHVTAGPARAVPKDELLPCIPELADGIGRALRRTRPDVVHAHFWMSGLAALDAAPPDVPVVQTFHALGSVKRRMQGSADTSPAERLELEAGLAQGADRVIASCTDEKREVIAMGGASERIDVVPSGVDCTWFVPDGPVAPRTRRHRLLTVGRLVPRKGVDDAITALQWVDDAELIIAGGPDAPGLPDDPEAQRLKNLADQLGLTGRVHLVGRVPHAELPELIRSADAVVCLPWYEPFGIVPLEAMACGVPVIGSAVGGLLDTVIDGETGALLPPRQPEAAARAINALLADDECRRGYGRAGRERALGYTWERVAQQVMRTYLRAIVGRDASRQPALARAGRAG